jgi:hypothetical protein
MGSPLLVLAFLADLAGMGTVSHVVGGITSGGVALALFTALFVERREKRRQRSARSAGDSTTTIPE